MSEDNFKKLIEAGKTAEDIEKELARRKQAPKKKITKKIEPHPQDITVEVKTIKPESIPDTKEDDFVQFIRNKLTEAGIDEEEYANHRHYFVLL